MTRWSCSRTSIAIWQKAKNRYVGAREGAEEVALPVLASTITTCIVFFPVMFLFGVAKYLFSALALAVVLSMAASYLVSMSIIPLYCARFLTAEQVLAAETRRGSPALFAIFNRAYERFAGGYERLLERALDHKAVVVGARYDSVLCQPRDVSASRH